MLNSDQIAKMLMQDFDYPESQVESVTEKLLAMDASLVEAFNIWTTNGKMPEEPIFGGFSPYSVAKTYPVLKPPAIFLLLEWLRRDTQEALSALLDDFGTSTPVITKHEIDAKRG